LLVHASLPKTRVRCSSIKPKTKTYFLLLITLFIFTTAGCQRAAKFKYIFKNKAKTRPKNILNYDKKLSSLIKSPINKDRINILVEKSKYILTIKYNDKAIKQYPVVLGSDPVNDKLYEDDSRTPEGKFKIKMLYPHKRWSKFLWLNYPTIDSWKKHNNAKKKGLIEQSAGIGGEVGIHGPPKGKDYLIDDGTNWTAGCISLKQKDVDEIYKYCQIGTTVEIK
jgi:murein L,D-transpeptidase YafK